MSSQLIGVHSFRRPTTKKIACNNDLAINLSLSHSQISYSQRFGIGGGTKSTNPEATSMTPTNFRSRCSRWLVNNRGIGVGGGGEGEGHAAVAAPRFRNIRARTIKRMLSPGSYLLRRLKALLYFGGNRGGTRNNSPTTTIVGSEVLAVVEPYLSIPIVPVSTSTIPPI